MFRAGYKYIDP